MGAPDSKPTAGSVRRLSTRAAVVAFLIAVVVVVVAMERRGDSVARQGGVPTTPAIGGAPTAALNVAPEPGGDISESTLKGQNVVIATPAKQTKRAVIFLHGAGQNSRTLFTDPTRLAVVRALNAAGFTVAATDATGDGWGNGAGAAAYFDLVADLRSRGYRDFAVLAESMGGLYLPRVMAGVQARAAAAWYPVCDLSTIVPVGTYSASIAAAFEGSLAPQPGLNPVTFASEPGAALAIWASPDDTVVPKVANADVCATQARAAGINVTETTTTGQHGDASNIQPSALAQFFSAAVPG